MNSSEKLQIAQQVSGLTQEQLADEVGVSFATVNSWMNGRSEPRKKHKEKIDQLYRKLTGQKTIPDEALEAKKSFLKKWAQSHKNVARHILETSDLYDALIVKLTYNSNSIEGNTLTEPETAAVLLDDAVVPNKDMVELMEAKNHRAALDYMFSYIEGRGEVNETFALELHGRIMNGIRKDAGIYRNVPVRIAGANVPTANPRSVKKRMDSLFGDIKSWKGRDLVAYVSQVHAEFEQIHPFSDGNGRVGRLLLSAMLLSRDFPVAIIDQNEKHIYYQVLNTAQTKSEHQPLENVVVDASISGATLIDG